MLMHVSKGLIEVICIELLMFWEYQEPEFTVVGEIKKHIAVLIRL